jgi:prepilin-type processing-associated H-X9-DG protein
MFCSYRYPATALARRGLTMVELLVAMSTIAVVVALLVPAVFAARGRARVIHCQNTLKQLALASCHYVDVYRSYPRSTTTQWEGVNYSCTPLAAFLPFADSQYPSKYAEQIIPPAVIPLFLCPDDTVNSNSPRSVTYRVNSGSSVASVFYSDGAMAVGEWLPPKEITDGLSQTALISEVIGIPRSTEVRPANTVSFRHFFVVNSAAGRTVVEHNERAIESCEQRIGNFFPSYVDEARGYVGGGLGDYAYHHALLPNLPVCKQNIEAPVFAEDFLGFYRGASSEHPGGVNVAFADGHVKFISNTIDKAVWRAMGTRAGNDFAGE